eukprot:scaffold5306_cov92-Skeletonema_marinoi.AAC.4
MQFNEQQPHINSRQQRKLAYRARNRLLSIHRDAQNLKQRVYDILESHHPDVSSTSSTRIKSFPWLPNKNCGSWYLPPNNELTTYSTEVYFKSSDGHITSNYAFSLKRLNLPLIELLHQVNYCFLVDSSVRKILPDSFSRTIPVWCCVMNRIVQQYRAEFRQLDENNQYDEVGEDEWDTSLYTPASIVSPEEYAEISSLIGSRVELLYSSKAIVNPSWLVSTLNKPLRPMWIVEGQVQSYTNSLQLSSVEDEKYYTIICCNPSNYHEGSSSKNHIHWKNHSGSDETSFGYYYTPGAADDDSEWGRNLSPNLFWSNYTEYPDIQESIKEQQEQRQRNCFYLQLPVAEGKKDKIELERWMPQKRRVLVYGTKGRDRAVAVVLAFVVLACPPTYPLKLKETFAGFDIDTISQQQQGEADNIYHHSDLHLDLVDVLLDKNGRETFLHWMHNQASLPQEPFADKESLRIVLQLVTQYRENAETTRSTMQKLNRFFMSSSMYRHI